MYSDPRSDRYKVARTGGWNRFWKEPDWIEMAIPVVRNNIADHDVVLKFAKVSEHNFEQVTMVSGEIKVKHLIDVIDKLDLEANPRDAKVGSVTAEIMDSLDKTPDLFPVKSKGILIAASDYMRADRNRYAISINDPSIEGILDGGHNTMAIGMFVLQQALGDDAAKVLKKIKVWQDFRKTWKDNRDKIDSYRASLTEEQDELETLVHVELLIPTTGELANLDSFNRALLDICSARNNNAQLSIEAFANQSGFFDDLKKAIQASNPDLVSRIEWRPNEGGDLKVGDLVSLLWIPLSIVVKNEEFLDETGRKIEAPIPTQIYSSKGECLARFDRLMSSPTVSTSANGDYRRELKNIKVKSAFDMAYDLMKAYDQICISFPAAYNKVGNYGRITAVKKMNAKGKPGTTKFLNQKMEYKSPEGFIIPLVYATIALIEVNPDGTLTWKSDPVQFIKSHIAEVTQRFQKIVEIMEYDPQKVGKQSLSYDTTVDGFEKVLLKS